MKNKKTIILLLLIAIVGVVGLTLAYFSNTASIENTFNTKQYGTTVDEVFTSPGDWTPGTTTPKTLTVTNSGQVDEAVRVSYVETWTSKNSNVEGDLGLTQGNNRAAIINFANSSDWTKVTENNKDYYYYNYKLAPGETTPTLLNSVTFNSAITNDANCVTNETSTGKTVTCTSTGNGYDGATYKLTFTVETVQYDKYVDAWGTSATIENNSKPAPVIPQNAVEKLISKVNSSDKTYETGDRGEMFAFSHPQTEQMKVTTDYRYIGNVPNNYVKFNCDNDGTNCEIWRIIGVFEVDDGTGNYEQRIKLVRGSAFAETMMWNDIEVNEWTSASLNTFLNGDYLTRNGGASTYGLKELTQSQVSSAKYYLGGRSFDSTTNFGSTDELYNWERGTTVYNQNYDTRSISWIGTVGLIYPSDYGFTYSKGIDDVCYENLSGCRERPSSDSNTESIYGYPDSSWIYNSNNLDGQTENQWNWLLSHTSENSYEVFIVDEYGRLSTNFVNAKYSSHLGAVRPVVYLKSSIQITGGDGSELNPYTLSANNGSH